MNSRRASPTPSFGICVADVHRDLHRDRRHAIEGVFDDFVLQLSRVDVAGIAFGARDRHLRALLQHLRRILATHHRGHAELARDDRRVAGPAPAVGDDRGCPLHHRLPVGIGHVGHQDVAFLHPRHFGGVHDHAHAALPDLRTDGASAREHLAALADAIAREDVLALLLALHRLGPRLQDVELAVLAVPSPFDIHRTPVVLLDRDRVARELLDLGIGEREAIAIGVRHRPVLDRAPGARVVGEYQLDRLGSEPAPQDRRLARGEAHLRDVELVRIDRALHHALAEPVARGDENHLAEARLGVHGEHHARRANVASHHALNAGGNRHFAVGESLVHPVGDGAIVVERGEDALNALEHVVDAADVEVGFLLPREGRVGQILGGRRRAHREARGLS